MLRSGTLLDCFKWAVFAVLTLAFFMFTQNLGAGHACVRYTLLHADGSVSEHIADLRAVPDESLSSLVVMYEAPRSRGHGLSTLSPGDYFFGHQHKKDGHVKMIGGIFSRSYCTIRIDKVERAPLDPCKIWAMHNYFLSLRFAHAGNRTGYGVVGYDLCGVIQSIFYFWMPHLRMTRRWNCAQFISEGLFLAGMLSRPRLFPKAVWLDMVEHFILDGHGSGSIVYYKQLPTAKTLIHSAVSPLHLYKNRYYRKMEDFADVIVEGRKYGEGWKADVRSQRKPKRPNRCNKVVLRLSHEYIVSFLCVVWLAFGWPDADFGQYSFLSGLGGRCLVVLTGCAINALLY